MSNHQGEQPAEAIAQALKTQSPDWEFLREFYQDLHAHPELSGFEKRTASKIQEALAPLNCEVIKDVGGYGCWAYSAMGRVRRFLCALILMRCR